MEQLVITDESRFCLRLPDGWKRIWKRQGGRFAPNNIVERISYREDSVIVWTGIETRTELVVVYEGWMINVRYIKHVVLFAPFTGCNLIFMDDNTGPHRALLVNKYRGRNWKYSVLLQQVLQNFVTLFIFFLNETLLIVLITKQSHKFIYFLWEICFYWRVFVPLKFITNLKILFHNISFFTSRNSNGSKFLHLSAYRHNQNIIRRVQNTKIDINNEEYWEYYEGLIRKCWEIE